MYKTLRKLWIGDMGALCAHLKRHDPEARPLRSGTAFRLDEFTHDAQGSIIGVLDWRH